MFAAVVGWSLTLGSLPVRAAEYPPSDGYFARSWITDDGLPHNTVTGLLQDDRGYIWIATAGGLSRFDGQRFTEIRLPAEFRNGGYNIRCIAREDVRTLLVLSTGGRVVRVRDREVTLHPASAVLAGHQPVNLFVAPDSAIWIGMTDGALLRWQDGSAQWFESSPDAAILGRASRFTFAADEQKRTWIASGNSLGWYEHGRINRLCVSENRPLVIAGGSAGRIWICSAGELQLLARGKIETLATGVPWQGFLGVIRSLFEDHCGTLWIAAGRIGLLRWTSAGFTRVDALHGLQTAVIEDREQNLWVGTEGSGVAQVQEKTFRFFDTTDGLVEDMSNGVAAGPRGELWLANNSGGIAQIVHDRVQPLHLELKGAPLYLSTCVVDAQGTLWAGGRDGLFRVPGPAMDQPEKLSVPTGKVHVLFVARNGDVWFSADPDLWGYYHDGVPHLLSAQDGYTSHLIRAVADDAKGDVWAGALNGDLLRWDGHRVRQFTATEGLTGDAIHDLLAGADGALWIATAGGLILGRNDHFSRFGKEAGLLDDLLLRLLEDGRGNLWCASRSGLFFVPEEQLEAVANGSAARVWCRPCGRGLGLVGVSPLGSYQPSAARSADGRLWFATAKGVLAIDPSSLPTSLPPPPVFIDDVLINDRRVPLQDALEIPPGRQRIEFHLAALSFVAPETVQVRYRLEGADPDWVDAGPNRTASYSGLAPGTYRLRVIAANTFGQWNQTGAAISFTVRPAWWQQTWLKVCGLIVAAVGLGGMVRFWSQLALRRRLRRLEQDHALEKERTRIARDLHDELGGGLTEVNLLVDRLRHTQPAELPTALGLLADRMRSLSLELSSIVWTVSPRSSSLDLLAAFIGQHARKMLNHSGVECLVQGGEAIPAAPLAPGQPYHVLAIVKEALNNTLKHAHAQHAWISTACADGVFHLTIKDDGAGFDLDAKQRGFSNGLRNLQERADAIGARLEISSRPGLGTEISVSFPCHLPPPL